MTFLDILMKIIFLFEEIGVFLCFKSISMKAIEKEPKINYYNRWVFEISSGYNGYRCTCCGTWIYEDQSRKCNCNNSNKKSKTK